MKLPRNWKYLCITTVAVFYLLIVTPITVTAASLSNLPADLPAQNFDYSIEVVVPPPHLPLVFPFNKFARTRVSVAIPVDWDGTKLFISSLSPQPIAFEAERSWAQNQKLIFALPTTEEQKISIKGNVVVSPINLDLLSESKQNYLAADTDMLEKYVLYVNASDLIQSDDPKIIEVANKIRGEKTSIAEIIAATYDFVVGKIDYDYLSYNLMENGQVIPPQSAVETLEKGSGICGDYSRLLIALLRAQHIPARMVVGAVDVDQKVGEETPFHAWVQAYIPTVGFIDIDPTWGKDGKKYISDIDMRHIRMLFSTPESEIFSPGTNYFNGFRIMNLSELMYLGLPDPSKDFKYSVSFTKTAPRDPNAQVDGIRKLAPVIIWQQDDGSSPFFNPTKNTVWYVISGWIQNPVYLFLLQTVSFMLIGIFGLAWLWRKLKSLWSSRRRSKKKTQ
jgi:hypothetical protein